MKITPEDMDAVRGVWYEPEWPYRTRTQEECDTALALILVSIYDRGYEQRGIDDLNHPYTCKGCNLCLDPTPCPFTHSHTREWCGHSGCRVS